MDWKEIKQKLDNRMPITFENGDKTILLKKRKGLDRVDKYCLFWNGKLIHSVVTWSIYRNKANGLINYYKLSRI